jgi:hypothetical protein
MAGGESGKTAIADLPPRKISHRHNLINSNHTSYIISTDMQPMFEARPMSNFFPKDVKKAYPSYSGVSQYLSIFETSPPPERPSFEPPIEKKKRVHGEMAKLHEQKLELMASEWDPHSNVKATGFVSCCC